jgi:KDO2-lipid IV(A) lauroyltransferase
MYWILKSLEYVIGALPMRTAIRTGQALGWFAGSVIRFRRREVEQTLRTCFPNKSDEDIRSTARNMYLHLGGSATELFWYCRRGTGAFAPQMIFSKEQSALVEELKARNKGVLVLTAHIGNFELFGTFAALFGHSVTAVVKPIKNAGVQRFWNEQRDTLRFDVLPWRSSYRECVRKLRNNEMVAMIMDQNTVRSQGVFVDFFDRPACTTQGLALLASQSGAPVLPAFMVQRENFKHELVFSEVIEPPPDKSPETIQTYTQKYTAVIESWIREYPEQWIWLHRRWRTQPKPEPESIHETTQSQQVAS